VPPATPRPIAKRYGWRLTAAGSWGLAAIGLLAAGVILSGLGIGLPVSRLTQELNAAGSFLLGGGILVGGWRWEQAKQAVEVLRTGKATRGVVTQVDEAGGGRERWVIRYRFSVDGQEYTGQVRTHNPPEAGPQVGQAVSVLYLPKTPGQNALYPHP